MSTTDKHAERELEVFRRFSAAAGLSILAHSIEKRCPPEPDILCEIAGQGLRAFELVSLIDQQDFAQPVGNAQKLERAFSEARQKLSNSEQTEFQTRLGNALIDIMFSRELPLDPASDARHMSLNKARCFVPAIIKVLLDVDPLFSGEVSMPRHLAETSVRILRGALHEPLIRVTAGGSFDAGPLEGLQRKLVEKSYESDAPIELLAYFDKQPAMEHALPNLIACIEARKAYSCFRRVWVFDVRTSRILYGE